MDVLFKIQPIETFTQVLEYVLENLYDLNLVMPNKSLDATSLKMIKEDIKNIILETNLNTNNVNELLQSNFNDNERVRIFTSVLEKKKSELLNLTIIHYNCVFGETLNAFNWKLKLVCGTSDLKTLSYPFMQIALYTVNTNHKSRLRLYELNKDMLLKLITNLEEFIGDKVINDNDNDQ